MEGKVSDGEDDDEDDPQGGKMIPTGGITKFSMRLLVLVIYRIEGVCSKPVKDFRPVERRRVVSRYAWGYDTDV